MTNTNLSRKYVLWIDNRGIVVYFDQDKQPTTSETGPWPIVSVNERPEAESLLVLFCQKEDPQDRRSCYFLPGFQGTSNDLPFVVDRFFNAYDQMRNNTYVEYAPNVRNR